MPAASNAKVMSWIPRGEGKGGTFLNASYHDMVPDSTYQLLGGLVKSNAWVPFPNFLGYGFNQAGNVTTLDISNRYTGVSQTLVSSVIAGITNDGAGKSKVWNQSQGLTIRGSATLQPTTTTGRYCFATVKNRLYMANGADTPAISLDATAGSCVSWGVSPQTQSLQYQIVASNQLGAVASNAGVLGGSQGVGTVTGTGTLTWVSGAKFDYFVAGAVIYVEGIYNTVSLVNSTTQLSLTYAIANNVNVPYSYAPTGMIGNAAYTGTGGTQAVGSVAGAVLTWTSGVNFANITIGQTIYLDGNPFTVATITSTTSLTLAGGPGAGAHNLSYGVVAGNAAVNGLSSLTTWGPPGGLPVFIPGPGPPTMFPVPGSAVFIAGAASPSTPTVQYSETTISGTNTATISPTYAEATAGAPVTRNTQINFSNISFINGLNYQYGASYYSPTSGHCSNMCTILNIKDGAPNNANVSITVSGIQCTNDSFYTKIILWRSGAGTSTMYPLAILNNNTGNFPGNTITYTDFLGDDTALGTATGGPGKLAAPAVGQNAPPPADLNFIQYWDGRFWGAASSQIGILFFSARSSIGNPEDGITVGVPEECWPVGFTRNIPESDGRVTGLRAVGGNLFVLTDNNIYAVVGGNSTSYSLTRVSSKGHGTSHFATCVLPAEDVNSTDVLVHYGNDGRLYFLFGSGGDFPISYPIQSFIDAYNYGASNVTVGVVHTGVSSYIYLNLNPAYYGSNLPFYYDLERKIWVNAIATLGTGFVEGLLNGVLTQVYSDQSFNVLTASVSGSPSTRLSFITNTVAPAGDSKSDATLESVTVYTNEAPANINVRPTIDGVTLGYMTLVPETGAYAVAYHENPDAHVYVPTTVARGRLFNFAVTTVGYPAAFSSAIYEVRAVFSVSQAPEAMGASL